VAKHNGVWAAIIVIYYTRVNETDTDNCENLDFSLPLAAGQLSSSTEITLCTMCL